MSSLGRKWNDENGCGRGECIKVDRWESGTSKLIRWGVGFGKDSWNTTIASIFAAYRRVLAPTNSLGADHHHLPSNIEDMIHVRLPIVTCFGIRVSGIHRLFPQSWFRDSISPKPLYRFVYGYRSPDHHHPYFRINSWRASSV